MLNELTPRRKLVLGFAPTRRATYSTKAFRPEAAIAVKKQIEERIRSFELDLEIVNLDFLNVEGLLYLPLDAEKVARVFTERGVDAIFAPLCNFGNEEAVARLARMIDKPILIWGPKDYINPQTFYRDRDSQCGLFALSKVLTSYNVIFSYIYNCDLDDQSFSDGFYRFIGAVSVVKAFRSMRIGQIGVRPAAFLSVKCNELELLERFGIELVPISMVELKVMFEQVKKAHAEELTEQAAVMKARYICDETIDAAALLSVCALKKTVELWAQNEKLSAVATSCWAPMIETIGIAPCFAMSEVCDDGLPFICEADIHGAVSAVLALAATRYLTPAFLVDVTIRHPDNPNAELFWHCGVAAKALAKDPASMALSRHYNRTCGVVGEWEIKGGDLTFVRFDTTHGDYSLFVGLARGTEGPRTVGAYVWAEVPDWQKWEERFIFGPYIHHVAGVHGQYADILAEACRYIPGLKIDQV